MELTPDKGELLKSVPDFTSWKKAEAWLQKGQMAVKEMAPNEVSKLKFLSLEWSEIAQNKDSLFRLYPSVNWRKFILTVFLADLVSYSRPVDQVNFERLLYILHTFPQGFRIWWVCIHKAWWPLGYTGWYPMLETSFELFEKSPDKLKNRMVVPHVDADEKAPYVYLFNYSAAPLLKGSALTKALMKDFVDEITAQKPAGLACITVSGDGVRIANRFGMSSSGCLTIGGSQEGVFTRRT